MTAGRKRRRVQHEERQQKLLIRWRDRALADVDVRDSGLADLFHVPNGGGRTPAEAGIFKAMGTMPGVPDLCLPVPAEQLSEVYQGDGGQEHRVYVPVHGLWIEMKAIYPDGTKTYPTKAQREIHERWRARGYRVEVCWTWEQAAEVICDHLGLPDRVRPHSNEELKLWP